MFKFYTFNFRIHVQVLYFQFQNSCSSFILSISEFMFKFYTFNFRVHVQVLYFQFQNSYSYSISLSLSVSVSSFELSSSSGSASPNLSQTVSYSSSCSISSSCSKTFCGSLCSSFVFWKVNFYRQHLKFSKNIWIYRINVWFLFTKNYFSMKAQT